MSLDWVLDFALFQSRFSIYVSKTERFTVNHFSIKRVSCNRVPEVRRNGHKYDFRLSCLSITIFPILIRRIKQRIAQFNILKPNPIVPSQIKSVGRGWTVLFTMMTYHYVELLMNRRTSLESPISSNFCHLQVPAARVYFLADNQ